MKLVIITVGRKHDASLDALIGDYEQRLPQHVQLSWQYVSPVSGSDIERVKSQESQAIASLIKSEDFTILLDERGKLYDNSRIARFIEDAQSGRFSRIVFVIGGAHGLTDELRKQCDAIWSLSPLVFPHRIVRLVLAEQIYRSYAIIANHPYHHQ